MWHEYDLRAHRETGASIDGIEVFDRAVKTVRGEAIDIVLDLDPEVDATQQVRQVRAGDGHPSKSPSP